jgi:hypothetical protein
VVDSPRGGRIAIVALDTLFVREDTVARIRARAARRFGIPPGRLMVAATHNHAGPACADCGDVATAPRYLARMEAGILEALGLAVAGLEPAEWGPARVFESGVAHNRRIVMRDGTARTHGRLMDPDAAGFEGPVDPELSVLAFRGAGGGAPLGLIAHFACHPAHHGGDRAFSAGFPGVVAARLREWPVTLWLNGAQGDLHTGDPATGADPSMAETGRRMALSVRRALARVTWAEAAATGGAATTIVLPFRRATPAQVAGTVRGAQRFVDPAIYDRAMPGLLAELGRSHGRRAEFQALRLGGEALVSLPGEFFAELGLAVKARSRPWHVLPVGLANGNVGYVPTRGAHARGGYETTFGPTSALAPGAGGLALSAAVAAIRRLGRPERP